MCRIGVIAGTGDFWWHIDRFMRAPEAQAIFAELGGALQSNANTRVQVCARAAVGVVASNAQAFLASAA